MPHAGKVDIAGLAHTLDTSLAQLRYAADLLDPWGLGHCAGPAIRWITRHQHVVRAAPTETLRVWTAIAAGQSAILRGALGDLLELDGLARSAKLQPGTPDARPFRDVIESLGIALGESHLPQAAAAELAAAQAQKASVPLVLLDRTLRASREASQELAGAPGGAEPGARSLATVQTLEASALQLREQAMVTGVLDVRALETLTVATSEQTLRTRLITLHGKLGQLLDGSDAATDGFLGHVGNLKEDIWALRAELATLRPRVWAILETMQREAMPAPHLPQDPAQAQEAFAGARKEAVAHAHASLAELTVDGQLHALFQRALETIPDAARNSARFQLAVQVAALIGVGVLGGIAGAMAGSVVRGALLADVAVDSAAFARGAAMARWAGAAANVATDAAAQSVGQTAMFGGNTKLTFIENLATNVLVLGALRPLHALTSEIGRLDRSATGLWKVASGGKVVLVESAKLTVETLAVAGAAYAVTRLVEGKPPPSDDVLVSWAVQGASMAMGKFIHGQLQGLTERWGDAIEARVHLRKRANALKELAKSVEASGDPDAAVALMMQHVKLLNEEHHLLQGSGAAVRLGLDERQLATMRTSNRSALADTQSPAFTFTWLRAFGLSPVTNNGLVWSGTRGQIIAALDDIGAPHTRSEHAPGQRWTAQIEGHEVTFLAVGDAPARRSIFGPGVDELGPDRYGMPADWLEAMHRSWAEMTDTHVSALRYDPDANSASFEVTIDGSRMRFEAHLPPRLTSFAQLDTGKNQVIGNPVPAAEGPRILRALVDRDPTVLSMLGIEGTPRMPTNRSVEFALGQLHDGRVVIVLGQESGVHWSNLPGLAPIAHTHPRLSKIDQHLQLKSQDQIPLSELLASNDENVPSRETIFPSVTDFLMMAHCGIDGHRVYAPYLIRGDYVVIPKAHEWTRLEFTIGKPVQVGSLRDGSAVFRSRVVGRNANDLGPAPIEHDVWVIASKNTGHLRLVPPSNMIPSTPTTGATR